MEIFMNKIKPMVSVLITSFNHERYIKRALDSVRRQKVNFLIEVLVGDDCSPDKTQIVLKEYEKEYPGFCTVLYRKENMYKKKVNNLFDLEKKAKGKYIIILEGDDYWIDDYKLQKEVDFLETHPEYVAVAHNCIVVDEYSEQIEESYPECKDLEYTIQHFYKDILPGQLTTILKRNLKYDDSLALKGGYNADLSLVIPTDRLYTYTLLCYGKIYCMQEKMSAYRHVLIGSSWSATHRVFPRKASIVMYKWYSEYSLTHNKQFYILSRRAYLGCLVSGIKLGDSTIKDVVYEFLRSKYKLLILFSLFKKKGKGLINNIRGFNT